MVKEATLEAYKAELIRIIEQYLPHCHIYLFGSRATGINREGADIDVAIECNVQIARRIISQIIGDIEDANIPVLVDIVDLNSVSTEMRTQILKEKVIWKN